LKDFYITTDVELINKIIKIQSFVRGMRMREKIKLKSKQKNKNLVNSKKTDFIENSLTQENEEKNEIFQKNYNEIIVKYILFKYIFIFSQKQK
jgi:hypothetical protein